MTDAICTTRRTCRICGCPDLRPVLDLGDQYIASHFVTDPVPPHLLERYPLQLVRCAGADGPSCGLVQLKHSVSPTVLYADYGYRSGINRSMRDHLAGIADAATRLAGLRPSDTVLDIGCNDGTLLCAYPLAVDRLGIDPAPNIVPLAAARGVEVVNDFFSAQAYCSARPDKRARVVTSIAMFYDLEDPSRFVRDVAAILTDDGLWVIELSYLPAMLQNTAFDGIVHEHLEYYALAQIEWMLVRHGLQVHRVAFNDVNGGSLRVYVRTAAFGPPAETDRVVVERVRENERALRLDTDQPFAAFGEAIRRARRNLRDLLDEIAAAGKSVYGYGASTKGNTLLQYYGIDNTVIPKIADRNPYKWGRRTLGTNIPIVSEEQARAERPDYFLVLPWHFFPGFVRREAAFLENGGKFILPLPEVAVVGAGDERSLVS